MTSAASSMCPENAWQTPKEGLSDNTVSLDVHSLYMKQHPAMNGICMHSHSFTLLELQPLESRSACRLIISNNITQ